MIVEALLSLLFGLIQLILTPLSAAMSALGLTDTLDSVFQLFDDVIQLGSTGFGLAAYFTHWPIVNLLINAWLGIEIVDKGYKLIMWIYRKIPIVGGS